MIKLVKFDNDLKDKTMNKKIDILCLLGCLMYCVILASSQSLQAVSNRSQNNGNLQVPTGKILHYRKYFETFFGNDMINRPSIPPLTEHSASVG